MARPSWLPGSRRAAARGVAEAAARAPRPIDRHRPVAAGEGPPSRVLLFGSGPAAGWGVRDHGTGLTASLANALAARLQHRVTVEPLVDDEWREWDPIRALQEAGLDSVDAVVQVGAYRASIVDLSLDEWRAYVDELRDTVILGLGGSAVIQVLALPWADAAERSPSLWGGAVGATIADFTAAAADSVDGFGVIDRLELSPPEDAGEWIGPAFSPATYRAWGDESAARLAPRMVRAGVQAAAQRGQGERGVSP